MRSGLFIPAWRHAPYMRGAGANRSGKTFEPLPDWVQAGGQGLTPSSVAVVPSAFPDAERYGALAEADAHAAVLISDAASPKCSSATDGQVWVPCGERPHRSGGHRCLSLLKQKSVASGNCATDKRRGQQTGLPAARLPPRLPGG